MTVSSASRRQVFSGSGSTGPFTFGFPVQASSHITVTHVDDDGDETTYTTPTHYSITLTSSGAAGGSITLVTALAVGETLVIEGATPRTQATDFSNYGRFNPDSHESALDKLTMIVQEQASLLSRAITIPTSDETGTTVLLPTETERASLFLGFDASGNVIATTGSTVVDSAVDAAEAAQAAAELAETNAETAQTAAAASATAASASASAAAASAASIDTASIKMYSATHWAWV